MCELTCEMIYEAQAGCEEMTRMLGSYQGYNIDPGVYLRAWEASVE